MSHDPSKGESNMKPEEYSYSVDLGIRLTENHLSGINLDPTGLAHVSRKQPNFPMGPRNLTNQGKHFKYYRLEGMGGIHTSHGHRGKKPDGSYGQKVYQRTLDLLTLIPRGKDYVKEGEAIPARLKGNIPGRTRRSWARDFLTEDHATQEVGG